MQPDPGEYRVQGWEVDESNNEIFIMAIPKNKTPRNFVIPFDLKNEHGIYINVERAICMPKF